MARIRTIKPDFFSSEDTTSLTPLSRLFYVSLWCEADREGRFAYKPGTLKNRYFPADKVDIDRLMDELVARNMVKLYFVDQVLGWIPSFKNHQVINNREQPSTLPEYSIDAMYTRESGVKAEGRKEGKEMEGRKELCGHRPTLDEVRAYCLERSNKVNPEAWLDHYTSNGWKVGKNPMKDWKAAIRTWERSDFGTDTKEQPTLSPIVPKKVCSHCGRPGHGSFCSNPDCDTNNDDDAVLQWI